MHHVPSPLQRALRTLPGWLAAIAALLLCAAGPHAASAAGEAPASGSGRIVGQVYDAETGVAIAGVRVAVVWPPPVGGGEPRQETRESDAQGNFEFPSIPAGSYVVRFDKSGYRPSRVTDLEVKPGEERRADFPLPPLPKEAAPEPTTDIEEFVVTGSALSMESLELRVDSDELLNVLTAEELSKYAASDVAEGLKRVAGVNVVEGQFAVIRGLEDRYSSTTYNSAPIPSPDPDRQSVQLDLFPSEVVSNIVVTKTFRPDLPSNSAGGSIDIVTHDYPADFQLELKAKGGLDTNAIDRYLGYVDGSPMGKEEDATDVLDREFGGAVGGRTELAGHEIRYKGVLNWQVDYVTGEGFQEGHEPRPCNNKNSQVCLPNDVIKRAGDLALGQLFLSNGRFGFTQSDRDEQGTAYGGLGVDLDRGGNNRLDGSVFYTKKKEEIVQLKENGYLPNFDYSVLAALEEGGSEIKPSNFRNFATLTSWITQVRGFPDDPPARGPLWFSNFSESKSFKRDRDLLVTQLNGDHRIDLLPGLNLTWAGNYAHTTQDEVARGSRYFFEPDDKTQIPTSFPVTVDELGSGQYVANKGIFFNNVQVDESQGFGRMDLSYTRALSEVVTVGMNTGGWYEHATRSVDAGFLESPTVNGNSQFAILADTPLELGKTIFGALDATDGVPSFLRDTQNDAKRTIWAWNLGSKATFWDRWDALGGFRMENITISSETDPFTGDSRFGAPATFPETYLFFDRLDNQTRGEIGSSPATIARVAASTFNDQLLGIDVPANTPCPSAAFPDRMCVDLLDEASILSLVNNEIDEFHILPTAGFALRPLPGLSIKGAWSKTIARPSFREMGFYVSVEPASDDLVVGNPQLKLSKVESWDLRTEYTWGEEGDLAAVTGFYKTIQDPIESIVIRNPLNFEQSGALYRTFFNNPNEATVWGIEAEARKNLGFLEYLGLDWGEYFSIGGNYTYINATVDRIDAELGRAAPFFGVPDGETALYTSLDKSRRLFGQPEWIFNADITFDQPDWGTKATLSYFAISDILDAAGSVYIQPNGMVQSMVPDRYVDSYGQLDLVISQKIWRGLSLKLEAKNLTDTTRRIVYDPAATAQKIPERAYKLGQSIKLEVKYTF